MSIGALWRWMKWEFDRDIEMTTVIRLITIERFVKGGLLVIAGVGLLVAGQRTGIHDLAVRYQVELNLQQDSSWVSQVARRALSKLANLKASTEVLIALGAIGYGSLEVFEGVGLLMRKRWAEYVVVVATAAFIPLEVDELLKKPTVLKAAGFLVNVAIVIYLVWSKRLFVERPSDDRPGARPSADRPASTTGGG